jgi:hypothetical protein
MRTPRKREYSHNVQRNQYTRHLLKMSGSATCSLADLALPAYRPNSLGLNVDWANQSPHVSPFSRSDARQTGGFSGCNASTDKGARSKRKETADGTPIFQKVIVVDATAAVWNKRSSSYCSSGWSLCLVRVYCCERKLKLGNADSKVA